MDNCMNRPQPRGPARKFVMDGDFGERAWILMTKSDAERSWAANSGYDDSVGDLLLLRLQRGQQPEGSGR